MKSLVFTNSLASKIVAVSKNKNSIVRGRSLKLRAVLLTGLMFMCIWHTNAQYSACKNIRWTFSIDQQCPLELCISQTWDCGTSPCGINNLNLTNCYTLYPDQSTSICFDVDEQDPSSSDPCVRDCKLVNHITLKRQGTSETISLDGTDADNFLKLLNGQAGGPITIGSFFYDCNGLAFCDPSRVDYHTPFERIRIVQTNNYGYLELWTGN